MPFQLVRLFRRRNYRAASAATSNVSELAGTSNSLDNNDAQVGALVQSLNNTNIGTIHGSLFSNNQIHHHHHHHSKANDDEDYAEIKVRDIILETELGSGDTYHDLQYDGTLVEVGRIQKYTGRLFHQPHGSMLIHKYEGLATKNWKRDFHRLAGVRHPNIIQLYGLCHARNFTALIFHYVQQTDFREYHLSLSGSSFVTCIADLMDQFWSAVNALQGHGLEPSSDLITSHNVDYAGRLVVDTFGPKWGLFRPTFPSLPGSDLKALVSIFKHKSLTRSSLVEYYDLLRLVCSLYDDLSLSIKDVSIICKGITTEMRPPLPYIARSLLDSQQIPVKLEYISDMLRCTIPISHLRTMSVFDQAMLIEVPTQKSSGHSSSPLFHVLASQIHHIIKIMKMNASEMLTVVPYYLDFYCGEIKPATPLAYDLLYLWYDLKEPESNSHWWSTDPEGQIPISNVVEDASHIRLTLWSYHIPQQIYPTLWDIHNACGFNPESTEMTEYLGYPLLEPRTDSGSMSHRFDPSQEADQPSHSEYDPEVDSDDGSSSSHETFVSALSES